TTGELGSFPQFSRLRLSAPSHLFPSPEGPVKPSFLLNTPCGHTPSGHANLKSYCDGIHLYLRKRLHGEINANRV
ncbi:hypothetical protein ACU5YK_006241, partial [Pseudomonas aeruginosa]